MKKIYLTIIGYQLDSSTETFSSYNKNMILFEWVDILKSENSGNSLFSYYLKKNNPEIFMDFDYSKKGFNYNYLNHNKVVRTIFLNLEEDKTVIPAFFLTYKDTDTNLEYTTKIFKRKEYLLSDRPYPIYKIIKEFKGLREIENKDNSYISETDREIYQNYYNFIIDVSSNECFRSSIGVIRNKKIQTISRIKQTEFELVKSLANRLLSVLK